MLFSSIFWGEGVQNNNVKGKHIKRVVIVGGGTAGWMTAAALSKALPLDVYELVLIESDSISTVGVGEATIPAIVRFNSKLGINESEFLRRTSGTFKLGIEFQNWGDIGESYMHPFGWYGGNLGPLPFHNYWLKYHQMGFSDTIEEYSITAQLASRQKFMRPTKTPNSPLSQITYAYHFDAGSYATLLREFSENNGVQRIEGVIGDVVLDEHSGYITAVKVDNECVIRGDLFIDCTGFRSLLIGDALQVPYDDWSDLLPCNKAVTVQTGNVSDPRPYTQSIAHPVGWQWRIPLQHRTGNGYVYCDKYISDEEATEVLLDNVEGEPLSEVRQISFQTGRREKAWHKNCVAIGLSSGFIEPLESTSIYLIESHIAKLIDLFPYKEIGSLEVDKFNLLLEEEIFNIRDFIALHYHVTNRRDTPFWNYCRAMGIPGSLKEKLSLYQSSGRIFKDRNDLFDEVSWFAVMHGQGLVASNLHPIADSCSVDVMHEGFNSLKYVIQKSAELAPIHQEFINKYCSIN